MEETCRLALITYRENNRGLTWEEYEGFRELLEYGHHNFFMYCLYFFLDNSIALTIFTITFLIINQGLCSISILKSYTNDKPLESIQL